MRGRITLEFTSFGYYASRLQYSVGSSPLNVHSQNIARDNRVFVVIFDTSAPEGTGEGVYMEGSASLLHHLSEDIAEYQFISKRIWINDEAKKADGGYRHDIRVEIDLEALKNAFLS